MKIVTFNACVCWAKDGVNSFIHRSGMIAEKIAEEQPDVIGFQEVSRRIYNHLCRILPEYYILFSSRTEDLTGEGVATAIRKDSVQLLELDRFWLSDTPRIPGSRYEIQSNCPRICQYLTLRLLSNGTVFRVYNTHFDHANNDARKIQFAQVLRYVADKEKEYPLPLFILGDFNAPPYNEVISLFTEFKTPEIIDTTADVGISFHSFGLYDNDHKIDYIYTGLETAKKVQNVELWKDMLNGIYLSDHYPIQVTLDM